MSLIKFELSIDTENGTFSIVNTETGESQEVSMPKTKKTTTRSTKKKKEESSDPQLILEENKYTLNTAAQELMGVEADSKISIKYKKINKTLTPIIGTEEAWGTHDGNRLTKTGTVACRGKNNAELARFGNLFTLSENPDGSGTFILSSDSEAPSFTEVEDENVEVPDKDLVDDINSLGGVEPDDEAEVIDGDAFSQMLNNL